MNFACLCENWEQQHCTGGGGSYDNMKCEISKFLKIFCLRLSENCEKIEKEFLLHYFSKNDAIGLF